MGFWGFGGFGVLGFRFFLGLGGFRGLGFLVLFGALERVLGVSVFWVLGFWVLRL